MITCKNCHSELPQDSNYCNHCGAKIIRNRLTVKHLFEHFTETFFNYDNKLLRTIIDLFAKPDVVIGGYIKGIRKRYVNPLSFFGLMLTLVGLEWFILRTYYADKLDFSALAYNSNESSINNMFNYIQDYSSVMMMLFVPGYALVSRTVFFDNKKYNYIEHIVIFTYVMTLLSLVGAVLNFILIIGFNFNIGIAAYFNLPLQIIFTSYCFKKLYNISTAEILGRTILSFVVFMVLYIILIILIFLLIYAFEGKEGMMQILETFRPKN